MGKLSKALDLGVADAGIALFQNLQDSKLLFDRQLAVSYLEKSANLNH